MIKKNNISFLLGAGFSKPQGYPLASEINQNLLDIREDQFTVHTSGIAWFHRGKPNPTDWFMQKENRVFMEKLIQYYNSIVSSFHYEEFYDWYKDLREGRNSDSVVENIAYELNSDSSNHLLNFDNIFNQLLSSLTLKWYPEVHKGRGLPFSHAKFLNVVEELNKEGYRQDFHTLNHDLFFESLSSTDAIQGQLCDGFTELGSEYYGNLENSIKAKDGDEGTISYRVRLEKFTGVFNSLFNLYKLHGSVDFYVFHDKERMTIRTKRGVGPLSLMKEYHNGQRLRYFKDRFNYYPSFLSGTTYKMIQYNSTPYYETIFHLVKENLQRSNFLIIIGYSFGDESINKMIKDYFLNDSRAKIIIVDINKPDIPEDLIESTTYIEGGVSDFNEHHLLSIILSHELSAT